MRFTYSSGQRPLEGYTLKRGIGRGGFGEVYFALSDGGKEVALKLVRGEHHAELRGVAHCLNLKHPNLVDLYDLKIDARGDHWVVMEYVAGEPLSTVLARHPRGLAPELAREWFVALARAVGYLHDHGIVHRDLKPGNIFLEHGTLKVGDYGLSKLMGSGQQTGHTQSVGTVHYMAPEISTGNYNKQVDIYAAGIILYEMLTGRPPFEGESCGEILMKHLTSPPDLSKVPEEFVPVLSKALAKNPNHRFATMAEMVRALDGGHIPEALPAEPPPVGRAVPLDDPVAPPPRIPKAPQTRAVPVPERRPRRPERPLLTALPAVNTRTKVQELCGSLALSVLVTALAAVLWAALTQTREITDLGTIFFLTVGASWGVLIPSKFWADRRSDSWARRGALFLVGGALGLGMLWLEGYSLGIAPTSESYVAEGLSSVFPAGIAREASWFSYFALAFFALRWWRMTSRRRPQRFSFAPLLAAGFWGLVLLLLFRPMSWPAALALVLASAIVQLVSPWDPPSPAASRRVRLRYA
jgi:hypothetical protein